MPHAPCLRVSQPIELVAIWSCTWPSSSKPRGQINLSLKVNQNSAFFRHFTSFSGHLPSPHTLASWLLDSQVSKHAQLPQFQSPSFDVLSSPFCLNSPNVKNVGLILLPLPSEFQCITELPSSQLAHPRALCLLATLWFKPPPHTSSLLSHALASLAVIHLLHPWAQPPLCSCVSATKEKKSSSSSSHPLSPNHSRVRWSGFS